MPQIEGTEFDVYCEACGAGLCGNTEVSNSRHIYKGGYRLTITPCSKCLDRAKNEGIEEGINQAEKESAK